MRGHLQVKFAKNKAKQKTHFAQSNTAGETNADLKILTEHGFLPQGESKALLLMPEHNNTKGKGCQ